MNKSIIDLCESNQRQINDKGVTLLLRTNQSGVRTSDFKIGDETALCAVRSVRCQLNKSPILKSRFVSPCP